MIEISLAGTARAKIAEELHRCKRDLKQTPGFESGGWLWGREGTRWWGGLEVVEASGPGPDVTRSYGERTLGLGYMHDVDELFRREGLELVGNWHVHPSGDDQPSSADMECIAEILNYRKQWEARTERALMVIYNAPYLRGDRWKATPWVFHQGTGITGNPMLKPEPTILVGKD